MFMCMCVMCVMCSCDSVRCPAGLRDPVLMRLDVESKLSDQLKMAFLSVRHEDKPGE